MTRIRYVKSAFTNILCSKESVLCNNKSVIVNLYTDTLIYNLLGQGNNEVLSTGQGKTLADAKKRVKNDLKTLGANFGAEIRNRGGTKKL